ncbi:ENTH-domain-containing protein [Coniophora puteana RWD-64-598 SS2]|uniref:ENTH-domain-containing protein n=1 Tax=Coniophora puteana (strain RWD-64-598) TaxID=741705 RepID=A0A5M3MPU0_CONPW|nr:ENTH-domain-containing protein [Coniophora puteana RWD-64-598 SS2]EIW81077.1 ENTH-domain-containing protein [Coniophora puteana RWD-64-598 SS2]
MDRFDNLTSTLSNLTVYDLKSYYNQAKNVILNVSEMEAKVKEATNDDPWGASSTLMQDIAQGTFNFQNFNEIMPCIYASFMEKEARQWRQIYKALQLLEYLIKHGSERVVDDARSHISTLKMLRNFHYIDDKGKDEGLNVRNRARELVELLSDVDLIRTERRKAKQNRHKYVGTGNDPMSFTSGGSRYGGFGSDSLGHPGGGSSSGGGSYYGDRMSGSSSNGISGGFRDSSNRRDFEEYTAGDDETVVRRSTSTSQRINPRSGNRSASSAAQPPARSSKPKEPEVDLLGGFDDEPAPAPAPPASNAISAPLTATADVSPDDDFNDFQAAPTSPTATAASPASTATAPKLNIFEMLNSAPAQANQAQTHQRPGSMSMGGMGNAGIGSMGMGMGGGMGVATPTSPPASAGAGSFGILSPASNRQSFAGSPAAGTPVMAASRPTPARAPGSGMSMGSGSAAASPAPKPTSNFDDLWSMSLGPSASNGAGKGSTPAKSMKDLEKEKTQAAIWSSGQQSKPHAGGMGGFGNFGNMGGGSSASGGNSGGDDLLL